jgi:hypothetical protein
VTDNPAVTEDAKTGTATATPPSAPGVMSIPKVAVVVVGVLLLQLAFIGSYLGGLHRPTPRQVPFAVAGTATAVAPVRQQLQRFGDAVSVRTVADRAEAERQIRDRDIYGAYVPDPAGRTDVLLVASAASAAIERTATDAAAFARPPNRTLQVVDVVPLLDSDPQGLSGFYLVVGWVVGGYLLAALLGILRGSRPRSNRLLALRAATLVGYALTAGILSAVFVGPWTRILDRSVPSLAVLGFLVVLGTAVTTAALEAVFGVLGIGLAILLFVVLGNPSSGGPYAPELLPGFWRTIGGYLPPGAGTAAVRDVVYFGGQGLTRPLLVLCAYVVLGGLIFAAAGSVRPRPERVIP